MRIWFANAGFMGFFMVWEGCKQQRGPVVGTKGADWSAMASTQGLPHRWLTPAHGCSLKDTMVRHLNSHEQIALHH